MLERDPAAVREEPLEQRLHLVAAAVDVRPARGLTHDGVRLEAGHDRVGVTGGQRLLVLADDAVQAQVVILLQHRRPVLVAAAQWPGAVVDPQLADAGVSVAVGGDGHRQLDPSVVPVERHQGLLDAAVPLDDPLDALDDGVPLGEPGVGLGHEPREGLAPLDPAAHRVVELWLAGEGLHQRVRLAGHQALEVRDGRPGVAGLVADALE